MGIEESRVAEQCDARTMSSQDKMDHVIGSDTGGRTSTDNLLALIVCPKAAQRITHLTHPCSSNAVKEAADT
jgi:hypothetical protein